MSSEFDQFVKSHVESSKSTQLNLEEQKARWLEKLNELYTFVQQYLADYISDGSIKIEFEDMELSEELLGTYLVKKAIISIGDNRVKLIPIGTFLIGAKGRVDMHGPRGVTRFTVVPTDATAPRVQVTILSGGQDSPSRPQLSASETWAWKIATPPPRIEYINLNPNTFREALMGVING